MRVRSTGSLNIELVGGDGEDDRWRLLEQGCRQKTQRRRIFAFIAAAILMALLAVGLTVTFTRPHRHSHPPPPDKYTVALQKALRFFDAQKSGRIGKLISWREDSGLNDPVVGGFYDGGGHHKVTFTQAFSMTLLSWSILEYQSTYEAVRELNHLKDIIRWGCDYLINTFSVSNVTEAAIVSQVGSCDVLRGVPDDCYCWMRPEDMDYPRALLTCSKCAHIASEIAAALAAASLVFRDDDLYSNQLLSHARLLYHFGTGQGRGYSIDESRNLYKSTGFYDEYIWGATWMYLATGNTSYLKIATSPNLAKHAGAFKGGPDYGIFSWDSKLAGSQVLLARIRLFVNPGYPYEENLWTHYNRTTDFMCSYLPAFTYFKRTKGGLIQLKHGGPKPLQYVVNAAFLATLFSHYLDAYGVHGWHCGDIYFDSIVLREFANFQIDYILGNNPQNMSYIVGFGSHYPLHVHHRASSIPHNEVRYDCRGG